jgi:hypothetical protein
MPIPSDAGPPVPDAEDAYRAVLVADHWKTEESRPSSALFDDDVLSAELCSRALPSETVGRMIARNKKVLRLVRFNCGQARQIGFDTRDERDQVDPGNKAHVHVYNTWFDMQDLSNNQRKRKAKRMSELCTEVPF